MKEWMREICVPDFLVVLGAGVFVVGLALRLVGKTAFAGKCDTVRQTLKDSAQSLGQTERVARLQAEQAAVRSMPRRGNALMAVGGTVFVVGLIWYLMK